MDLNHYLLNGGHFSWPHAENFEVLDLSFDQLDKLNPVGEISV